MSTSIIILTYNSSGFIGDLLKSLRSFAKDSEILVVDNGSNDKTVELAKKAGGAEVYETGENLGFAKGINYGAKRANGEYLLLINPDARFKSGNLSDLVKIFEKDEKVGVVGGKLLNFDGKSEKSAGKFFNFMETLAIILGLDEAMGVRFSPNKIEKVDFVSGGFMMIRRSLFEKLGGLDENFFMYIEDMEFCYRVKKAGFDTVFTPEIVISHVGQGSSNRTFAILNIYKGILYFYKKQKNFFEYQIVRFGFFIKAMLVYLLGRITNNKYYVQTYGEALKLF